ncbi:MULTISPECIES: peptidase E [unclassified Nocardioides]|uniref:Type 1 glutamine amidotransferase-like domain-containing protein n=1 Tax=unclassified Nocardioides TaxID=2615069 RepID=UPI0009F14F30|nr:MULTISPECIES: peptidase E [unclassified Nocardioides]GAW51994.1 Peptidase E [Nocardioides sp. PD653-B2]GAW56400.1 Peptidase E [Nocardioides sp. PD653]
MTPSATILAFGGGGFAMEPDNPLLDDFLLSLAARRRGVGDRPRICFVPTASGDAEVYVDRFVEAFAERAETSSLRLFHLSELETVDLRALVLAQDVIHVGGGSTANLLALWRLHGLDEILREALAAGVVLSGVSAGMNCWFESSVTDSFGPLAALDDGLGFLAGSACPHYDGEPERQPTYTQLIGAGVLPAGYAADDGCALLFRDGELVEAVSSRPEARAFRVHLSDDGSDVVESALPVIYLG